MRGRTYANKENVLSALATIVLLTLCLSRQYIVFRHSQASVAGRMTIMTEYWKITDRFPELASLVVE